MSAITLSINTIILSGTLIKGALNTFSPFNYYCERLDHWKKNNAGTLYFSVYTALTSVGAAFSVRSAICLTSKCATFIPNSPLYLLTVALPIITAFCRYKFETLNNRKKDLESRSEKLTQDQQNKLNGFELGLAISAVSSIGVDIISTISSLALLYLFRATLATNPILFGVTLAYTVIDTTSKLIGIYKSL